MPGPGEGRVEGADGAFVFIWDRVTAALAAQLVKNPPARPLFHSWVGKIPWRRERLSTPVFWPGESHGQRSLAGYSPGGHKESGTTFTHFTHSLQLRKVRILGDG